MHSSYIFGEAEKWSKVYEFVGERGVVGEGEEHGVQAGDNVPEVKGLVGVTVHWSINSPLLS